MKTEIKIIGVKWLCSMFPSLNKRVADAIKPVVGLKIKRNLNKP
jgi:hypothetical protein